MHEQNPIETNTNTTPGPEKREIIPAKEIIINEIRDRLLKKGLSSDEITEIINLVHKEVIESVFETSTAIENHYNIIAKNAGPEWREIVELTRLGSTDMSPDNFAARLKEKFPDLDVRVDRDNFRYTPVKVRKIK